MKKNLLLFFALCFSLTAFAQDNFIDKHLAEYESDNNFDRLEVSSKTFELFTEIESQNADEKKVLGAIAKLDGIKALFREQTEEAAALVEEAKGKVEEDGRYEELIKVESRGDQFLFLIREDEETIRELTVIAGGDHNFMAATLYGEIDLTDLARLTSVIKENGKAWFDVFENIDKEELIFDSSKQRNQTVDKNSNKSDEAIAINVFPNPVQSYVQLEAIDKSEATYELEFFSSIGESVKKLGTVNLPYRIDLADLPTGAYFLRLTNAAGEFKNYRIVKP